MQGSKRFLVSILCVSVFLTSCSTLRDVPLPPQIDATHLPALKRGDHVVVTRRSGAVEQFRVTAVEADALRGKDTNVPYSDITTIEVHRFSLWRTSGVVVGVLVAAAGVVLYALIRADRNSD